MFEAIHEIALSYFSDRIDMRFNVRDYDTRDAGWLNLYLPTVHKAIYNNGKFDETHMFRDLFTVRVLIQLFPWKWG